MANSIRIFSVNQWSKFAPPSFQIAQSHFSGLPYITSSFLGSISGCRISLDNIGNLDSQVELARVVSCCVVLNLSKTSTLVVVVCLNYFTYIFLNKNKLLLWSLGCSRWRYLPFHAMWGIFSARRWFPLLAMKASNIPLPLSVFGNGVT